MIQLAATALGYRAVARAGTLVVADSCGCVRADHHDRAPDLWFPLSDARLDEGSGVGCRRGDGDLSGFVTFDADRVEIVDRRSGDADRDVTSKRFPTWGDAADLVADPPQVPGPYDSVPYDMSVTGRDLRIVDAAYTGAVDAPVGPPVLDAWVRFREVPPDPCLHAGLLAQFTGHLSIATALRPHAGIGEDQAHVSLSTAINAINLSIHADVRADRWMLYRHHSTFAGDGMTHSECRVHDEDGVLLASFTVDAMVRSFADPTRPTDRRSSM